MEVPENFDELPYYFEVNCDCCGKPFMTSKQRYKNNKTQCCSRECVRNFTRTKPNCECAICGKKIHRKPSEIKKYKNVTCSRECLLELHKRNMTGENNHQYGLKGELNSTYKNGEFITSLGYKKIYRPDHPKAQGNYVLEHRLVAEKYLLDDTNSEIINNQRILSDEYAVHHIDFNRLNNDIKNLCVMKKKDHSSFHNSINSIIRNKTNGQIIGLNREYKNMSIDELYNKLYDYINKTNCYYKMI